MRRIVAGGVLIVLTVAGCSLGPASDEGAAGASATASPSPLGQDEASQRYLEMVRPYDELRAALDEAVAEGRSLEEQVGLAGATAGALRAEIEGLRATTWPDEVQPQAEALVAAAEQALPEWEKAAAATTAEDLAAAVESAAALGADEAEALKSSLGG